MATLLKKYTHLIKKQSDRIRRRKKGFDASKRQNSETFWINGSRFVIRFAASADTLGLFAMHQRLSRETLYLRFLAPRRPSITELAEVCNLGAENGAAVVIQRDEGDRSIVGLAYYCVDEAHPQEPPEFTIVVEDRFQGAGMGKALLKHLYRHAVEAGVRRLNATVLPHNTRMRHLLHCAGVPVSERTATDTIEATVYLSSESVPDKGDSDSTSVLSAHLCSGTFTSVSQW